MSWSRFIPAGAFVILVIFLGIGLTRDTARQVVERVGEFDRALSIAGDYDFMIRAIAGDTNDDGFSAKKRKIGKRKKLSFGREADSDNAIG